MTVFNQKPKYCHYQRAHGIWYWWAMPTLRWNIEISVHRGKARRADRI